MARSATAATATPVQLHPDRRTWDREVQAYLGVVEAAGKSPNTVRTYRTSLAAWATWRQAEGLSLDPELATRREAQAWVASMTASLSRGTSATRFANLVTFFRWLVAEWAIGGDVRPSPFDHVKAPVARAPRVPVLQEVEVDRLLAACHGSSYQDLRDKAVLSLMVSAGLRRSEVAQLLVGDVDVIGRRVRIAEGKGDTDAWVPFGQVAADALRHYERARGRHRDRDLEATVGVRSDRLRTGSPYFLVDTRGGHYGGITSGTVANIVGRRASEAGLEHVHPHQLRHTFAHQLLSAGVQEGDVMTLGRWRNPRVMARYGADMREARAAVAYRDPLARRKGGPAR